MLRRAQIQYRSKTPKVMALMYSVDAPFGELVAHDVELAVQTIPMLEKINRVASAHLSESAAAVAGSEISATSEPKTRTSTPSEPKITEPKPTPKRAKIHLALESGFGREGFLASDLPALAQAIEQCPAVEVVGAYTHIAFDDTANPDFTNLQIANFHSMVATLESLGISIPLKHVSNSPTFASRGTAGFDMVRLGMLTYGYTPNAKLVSEQDMGIAPAARLTARLAKVKQLEGGKGISYGHLYHLDAPAKIGIVPLGYADGVPFADKVHGEIALAAFPGTHDSGDNDTPSVGVPADLVGAVCMDQFMVQMAPDAPIVEGDEVELFGKTVPIYRWGVLPNPYRLLATIGSRIPRYYLPF
jgi:alanine racemase